jgi:hypothetical protein
MSAGVTPGGAPTPSDFDEDEEQAESRNVSISKSVGFAGVDDGATEGKDAGGAGVDYLAVSTPGAKSVGFTGVDDGATEGKDAGGAGVDYLAVSTPGAKSVGFTDVDDDAAGVKPRGIINTGERSKTSGSVAQVRFERAEDERLPKVWRQESNSATDSDASESETETNMIQWSLEGRERTCVMLRLLRMTFRAVDTVIASEGVKNAHGESMQEAILVALREAAVEAALRVPGADDLEDSGWEPAGRMRTAERDRRPTGQLRGDMAEQEIAVLLGEEARETLMCIGEPPQVTYWGQDGAITRASTTIISPRTDGQMADSRTESPTRHRQQVVVDSPKRVQTGPAGLSHTTLTASSPVQRGTTSGGPVVPSRTSDSPAPADRASNPSTAPPATAHSEAGSSSILAAGPAQAQVHQVPALRGEADGDEVVYMAWQGEDAPELMPISSGTTPLRFFVNPSMPKGLTLDPDTGAISGTPLQSTRKV